MTTTKNTKTRRPQPAQAAPATNADASQADRGIIDFPNGLFGFPDQKRFVVLSSPEEAPFLRLQSVEDPTLTFLVVSPSAVTDDYQPEISDEDTQFLGLSAPHDALLFSIVSIQSDGQASANFKGPIVVNRRTLLGRQVIPVNSADCPVRHALPAAA
ncbi:MAG: hypothetical protein RJA22_3213 [Verrucomicrobiota bacterium]|jgi:flagellar assembly factor FliW